MGQNIPEKGLKAIAHRRLYPSLMEPNYLVLRRRRELFKNWLGMLPGDQRVLDIGGRYQPYRPLVKARQYVGLDLIATEFVDVVGRGEQLPFASNVFDLVIATVVFEYFPEPKVVANQIHRVLKPGGTLLLSVNAVSPRFVNEEHWRFTRTGLNFLLSGFSNVEIVPEVYSIGGFCRLANLSLNIFAKYEALRRMLNGTVVPAMNVIGLVFEKLGLSQNDQIAGNYSACAQK